MPHADKIAWIITSHAPAEILCGYRNIEGDLIAVDGGLKMVDKLCFQPKVIIGDFDSLSPRYLKKYPKTPVIRHKAHKNETDTELAIAWCVEQGIYSGIVICNDMQGRTDHALAILQNLLALHEKGIPARIENQFQKLFFLSDTTRLHGRKGDLISLISYDSYARFLHSEGLEYPLDDLVIKQEQSRGISNVFLQPEICIYLKQGKVLAIHTPKS